MVQRLTRSDIIHVEIIPVFGICPETNNLLASNTAYTAYVGTGYDAHSSHYCIHDSSYTHLFVPLEEESMLHGLSFLHTLHGKKYNYMALPLTILPQKCKFKGIQNLQKSFTPSKVFCSQMGLMLCYLCNILDPIACAGGNHPKKKKTADHPSLFFDPKCCTPGDLYHLLLQGNCQAMHCCADKISISSCSMENFPLTTSVCEQPSYMSEEPSYISEQSSYMNEQSSYITESEYSTYADRNATI